MVTIISSGSATASITNSINAAETQVAPRHSIATPVSEQSARGNSEREAGEAEKGDQGTVTAVEEERAENNESAN